MHKYFFTPLIFIFLALAIPTIALQDKNKTFKKIFELNANLDELILNFCNSYDSYTINKLYSEKEILSKDKNTNNKTEKFLVQIRKKPINPSIISIIKKNNNVVELSNFIESDLEYLNFNKRNFVRTVLPLIINENQLIISKRNKLIFLKEKLQENYTLNNNELKLLFSLANTYKVKTDKTHKLELIDDLLQRIDIIPNSIVLAQAAIESGWGSSRFAKDYNALFGEYTYDDNNGVIPLNRENGDTHLIKSFNSYNSSVKSYFNNINTHYAYKDFREVRNVMRDRNNYSNIDLLVDQLNTYAEDKNYIYTIKSVIKKNKFKVFDSKTITY